MRAFLALTGVEARFHQATREAVGPCRPSGRPETERASHYFEAVMAEQFDAFVWFERTTAVTPLGPEHARGAPETWPFGL